MITDLHRPHESLPDAAALIDAHQPGDQSPCKDLSGAGVVLKLLTALEDGDSQGILEESPTWPPWAPSGTWCPCWGDRTIVKAGLRLIGQGGRPGVDALLEQSAVHREPTASTLAFTAIPRINATDAWGPRSGGAAAHLRGGRGPAGLPRRSAGRTTAAARWRPRSPRRPWPASRGPPAAPQPGAGVVGEAGTTGHRHCGLPHYRAVRQALLRHLRGRGGGPGQRPQRGGLLPVRGGSSCGDFLLRFGGTPWPLGPPCGRRTWAASGGPQRVRETALPPDACAGAAAGLPPEPASLSPEMPRALSGWSPSAAETPSLCSGCTAWSCGTSPRWGTAATCGSPL